MSEFVLKTEPRSKFGSRSASRIRAEGRLPVNVYGHGEANALLTLDAREFRRFFDEGHRLLTLDIAGKSESTVIREVQYDAFGDDLLHVDLARVSADERIAMDVPVEILGAVKSGNLENPLHELHVEGPANAIPEHIELRVDDLKIGEAIRVRDVDVPAKCVFLNDPESVIVAVTVPRGEEESAEGAADASEPEVIGRKKEDESEE